MSRPFRALGRKSLGCLFTFVLLCLAVLFLRLFYPPILTAFGTFLIENNAPRKADAIVVLGGDYYGDRTLKGAELAKAGYAPYALISGPGHLVGTDADIEVLYATLHGYPENLFRKVSLPYDAESTRSESQFLGKLLRAQGIHSILLVTSNFHTRRAARLWRIANPTLVITPIASVDPYNFFTPATWWKTRPGQKAFLFEWMKTVSVMLGI